MSDKSSSDATSSDELLGTSSSGTDEKVGSVKEASKHQKKLSETSKDDNSWDDIDEDDSDRQTKASTDVEDGANADGDELSEAFSEVEERVTWSGAFDFLVACIGSSVGLGNVWKFPFLVYRNGGGAFLIPYTLCVLIGGIPLVYLEVAVGQYMSKGGLQAWNIVPLFQGLGLASTIVVFYITLHYNIILAWSFYYLFASFTLELPWETCEHVWNTENCTTVFHRLPNQSDVDYSHKTSPIIEYWQNKVLGISSGIDQIGRIKWDLAFCLLFSWIVVYCCVCNGIKTSGKVMYVTATSPYIFMLILLIRNAFLDGAEDGVRFYLSPDFSKIADPNVWKDAGSQILYSSSIGIGALTVLGSYNKFKHNSLRDTVIFSVVNSGTSFFAGFIVFTILGFMAKEQGRSVEEVAESGPGLAFIAYPAAVGQMPLAPLWSVLFFLMVILLGLDSQFVEVESVVTAVVDQFPHLFHHQKKDTFTSIACGVFFIAGLTMVTEGGMYVFQIFDHYTGGPIVLLIAFFELIAISYFYGIRRFSDNIKMMVGDSGMLFTLPFLMLCWVVISPIFCLAVFVLYFVDYKELTYSFPNKPPYIYPQWTVVFGTYIAISSAIWIPLVMIYKIVKNGVSLKTLKLLTVPYHLHHHQKRPQDAHEDCLFELEKREGRTGVFPWDFTAGDTQHKHHHKHHHHHHRDAEKGEKQHRSKRDKYDDAKYEKRNK